MFGSYHTDCFFQFDDYKANLNKLCVINRPDHVNEVQRSCCWNRDASAGIKHHFTHIYPEHFMFNFVQQLCGIRERFTLEGEIPAPQAPAKLLWTSIRSENDLSHFSLIRH